MQRIGYDADSQTYTFRDTDGSIWESSPGNYYGRLTQIEGPSGAENTWTDSSTSLPLRRPSMEFGQIAQHVWRCLIRGARLSWKSVIGGGVFQHGGLLCFPGESGDNEDDEPVEEKGKNEHIEETRKNKPVEENGKNKPVEENRVDKPVGEDGGNKPVGENSEKPVGDDGEHILSDEDSPDESDGHAITDAPK